MANSKQVLWYGALSVLTHLLLSPTGVNAHPHPQAPGSYIDTGLFHMGQHFDNGTGVPFHLFVEDETTDPKTAFNTYWNGCDESSVAKRGWFECESPSNSFIQQFGCNTAHNLGYFIGYVGPAPTLDFIKGLLTEAFQNGRGKDTPRSVCLTRDGKNLCVSWASYDDADLQPGENLDIATRAVGCAGMSGSSEFESQTTDGKIVYICVSNRATGCKSSVC